MSERTYGYGKGDRRHIAAGIGTISAVTALCGHFIPFGSSAVARELPICASCLRVERAWKKIEIASLTESGSGNEQNQPNKKNTSAEVKDGK
jgi:hypothetical protein